MKILLGIKATLGLPVAPNDGRKGSTYFYGEDMGTRKSSHSSFDFSMHDLEAQVANVSFLKYLKKLISFYITIFNYLVPRYYFYDESVEREPISVL